MQWMSICAVSVSDVAVGDSEKELVIAKREMCNDRREMRTFPCSCLQIRQGKTLYLGKFRT